MVVMIVAASGEIEPQAGQRVLGQVVLQYVCQQVYDDLHIFVNGGSCEYEYVLPFLYGKLLQRWRLSDLHSSSVRSVPHI